MTNHPLGAVYPAISLDSIVVKVRDNQCVVNKVIFVALGINLSGNKELLVLWLAEKEGAKFWLSVLTELKNRDIEDILIACIDDLKGLPEVIEAVYPNTQVQLCVVHMVRNSMRFVSWKDYKRVAAQLRTIYQAATEQQALEALEQFDTDWKDKYPIIAEQWRRHWDHLITMFHYLNRFSIEFGDRISQYLQMEFTQTNLQSLAIPIISLFCFLNRCKTNVVAIYSIKIYVFRKGAESLMMDVRLIYTHSVRLNQKQLC